MQEVSQVATALITAFGSHKVAVDYYLEDRNVERMYIYTMSRNKPDFQDAENRFKQGITEKKRLLDHRVEIYYIQINEFQLCHSGLPNNPDSFQQFLLKYLIHPLLDHTIPDFV